MFRPLPSRIDFPQVEREALALWDEHDVFRASVENRRESQRFVFYEGPPTANGMPHPGHCLTRVMKDIFPRYKAMCGFQVERKGGWDTHGLPVEREVCKELGIRTKQEIEAYGIEKFNLKCIQSVFRYTREWEEMTRRLGYWVDLKDAYVTFHQSYVESVWWSLKTLFERGVLYQGHKIVWWWAQGGTALSSGEVGEGYRKVDDPSVFVKFPIARSSGNSRIVHFDQAARAERFWQLIQNSDDALAILRAGEVQGEGAINFLVLLNGLANLPGFLKTENLENDALEQKIFAQLREWGEETCKRLLAPASLLVWTTTPWTLVSNQYAAMHADLEYSLVHDAEASENLYIATQLVESIAKKAKRELATLATCKGSDLVDDLYVPPFRECYLDRWLDEKTKGPPIGWRVVTANFVTIDSGTGIVHVAPAFGETDFQLLQNEHAERDAEWTPLPVLCAVAPDGTFNADAPERYRGRWVKDCDKDIIRELRDERKTPWGTPLLFHQEVYNHDYPFCPQSPDDPLIQYARKGWFVRTSQFKDEFLKNNAEVNWLPEHIKEGRFGDFLRNNVDWALSRERYWGTPLPIWQCKRCLRMEAIASFFELQSKPDATDNGYWDAKVAEHKGEDFPDHLRVHKPYIDKWTYQCTVCAGGDDALGAQFGIPPVSHARMERVPEVIDCWWDAGSMPFAQWGFPHAPGSVEKLADRFPADFISEAIDQTRGWFYGLLAISTLLRGELKSTSQYPVPYRTCIVLGHIFGEDGNKMSKKLRNYKEPSHIFDTLGADAMRWYFLSAQAPWTSTRFVEASIRDSQREFLVKLYNVLSFFTIYASIDGFDPSKVGNVHFAAGDDPRVPSKSDNPMGWRPSAQRTELDRWIITELRSTVSSVRASMDRFENFPAAQRLNDFVDALSNWYVRRSRDRFWRSEKDQEKWDAYHTLYGCLRVVSHLIAPFTPFFAEYMHGILRVPDDPRSIHLCDYPKPEDIRYHDDALAATMDTVRELVALGRAARTTAKLKVRQPLEGVELILTRAADRAAIESHASLVAEELNVKRVEFVADADKYVTYKVVPNFKAIGAKYRELVPKLKEALGKLVDPAAARRTLVDTGTLPIEAGGQTVNLTAEDVEIRLEARPGWSAAQGRAGVVVLNTSLTQELKDEGVVRELIHFVQAARKEQDLAYQARIGLQLGGSPELTRIAERYADVIRAECLVTRIETTGSPTSPAAQELDIEGHRVRLAVIPD